MTRKGPVRRGKSRRSRQRLTYRYEMLGHPFDQVLYWDIKAVAQDEVDEFLERHRRTGGAPGLGGPGEAEA